MKERVIRLAIDFGSTVSAMGWQLLEREQGNFVWETVPDCGWKKTFPTVILQKRKNPSAVWPEDLFADDAVRALRKADPESANMLKADVGFKEGLFSDEQSRQAECVTLAVRFFQYLRAYFEKNHNMSEDEFRAIPKEVYVTKPLIATIGADIRLLDIAEKAGFVPKNGYVCVKKTDEVRALVDLAMLGEDSPLRRELEAEFSDAPDGRKLALFIDIGGLTADITLAEICRDEGHDYQFRQLGMWPAPDESRRFLGGGVMLDMAIRDYLAMHGFIHPELTDRIIAIRKFMDFSDFKIAANNNFWSKGLTPVRLGSLGADYDSDYMPQRDYSEYPAEQLSPNRMMTEVGANYLRLLTEGVRKAIIMARKFDDERDSNICEENVDWVFLTGGGSQMFFIKPLLLGKLPQDVFPNQLRLEKLQAKPERILENASDDATLSCISGTLAYSGRMVLSANADYVIELSLYPAYPLKKAVEPLYTKTVPLSKKGEPLPKVIPERSFRVPFTSTAGMSGIRLEFKLLQNEHTEASTEGKWTTSVITAKDGVTVAKDAANFTFQTVKAAGPIVGALALASGMAFLGPGMQRQANNLLKAAWANNTGNVRGAVDRIYSDLDYMRKEDDVLEVRYAFTVDENRVLSGQVSIKANTIRGQEKALELSLG